MNFGFVIACNEAFIYGIKMSLHSRTVVGGEGGGRGFKTAAYTHTAAPTQDFCHRGLNPLTASGGMSSRKFAGRRRETFSRLS